MRSVVIASLLLSLAVGASAQITAETTADAEKLKQACDGGEAKSCFDLGNRYREGEGVAKDLAKAAQLYQKACEAGHAGSCFNLANRYREGEGVAKDLVKAAQLYQQACDEGEARACEVVRQLRE